MIKKQQMRWNRWTLQPFLDVRVAVVNKTLAGSFKRLYPDFQTDNDNHAALVATSARVAARSFIRALSTCLEAGPARSIAHASAGRHRARSGHIAASV